MHAYDDSSTELFFGIVGAVGTDLDSVIVILTKCLDEVKFQIAPISLSGLLAEIEGYRKKLIPKPEDQRIWSHMDAGNKLRKETGMGDALAILAINFIRNKRL